MRLVVVHVLLLAIGCGGGGGGSTSLLPGKKPNEVPQPPLGVYDAGADQAAAQLEAAAPPPAPADGPALLADGAAPPPPDAELSYPSCSAIGFTETGYKPCDVPGTPISGRRTADQHFTCAICALVPPVRACQAAKDHGDRPSLCVVSCESCPVLVNCDRSPCVQIGLDAGN